MEVGRAVFCFLLLSSALVNGIGAEERFDMSIGCDKGACIEGTALSDVCVSSLSLLTCSKTGATIAGTGTGAGAALSLLPFDTAPSALALLPISFLMCTSM